jgi:hypothetical protein
MHPRALLKQAIILWLSMCHATICLTLPPHKAGHDRRALYARTTVINDHCHITPSVMDFTVMYKTVIVHCHIVVISVHWFSYKLITMTSPTVVKLRATRSPRVIDLPPSGGDLG